MQPDFYLKKSIAATLLVMIIAAELMAPVSAHAILGIADTTITLPGSVTGTETITNPQTFGSTTWLLRYIVNPLARAFTRTLLTTLTQQVVNWISADGGNNVGFIGNFEKTLGNELDDAAGEFLDKTIPNVDFCGDIGAYLRLNLRAPAGGLRQRARCSLSAIVSNVQHFYDNFQNGGWEAFLKVNTDIQNNTAGAFLIALDAKLAAESRRKEEFGAKYAKSSILGFGKKAKTDCFPKGGNAQTQGQRVASTYMRSGVKQIPDDPFSSDVCFNSYEEQTPGVIIEQTLKDANKTGIEFGISAKDFDEAIGAIMTALLKRTISSASGIFGNSGHDYGGRDVGGTDVFNYKEIGPSQDSLRSRTEASIFLAYGAERGIDATVLTLRQELIATTSAVRQREIKERTADLLAKKQTLFAAENQLIATKQSSFNAVTQGDIAQIDGLVTRVMNQIEPIAQDVSASPYASPTGDLKTDTLNDLSGGRAKLASMINLTHQAIQEIDGALASTTLATTTRTTLQGYRDALTNTTRCVPSCAPDVVAGGALQQFQDADAQLQNEYGKIQNLITVSEVVGETGLAIDALTNANDIQASAYSTIQNAFGLLDSVIGNTLTPFQPVAPPPQNPPIPPPIEEAPPPSPSGGGDSGE